MANHISHASLPYPIKNARYTILVPFLDADGDPTDPTTPDTEISQDGGAFADAAEEITTITGSNGMGFITLTGAETNNSAVGVAVKVASGPKATLMTLYPRTLPIVESGTAQAGAAGSITLAVGAAAYDLTGCFVRTTGGTGGGGTGGANNQVRPITAYNTSTKVATISPNWETATNGTTTYDVLLPEGLTMAALKGLCPTVLGRALDVSAGGEAGVDWANVGSATTTVDLSNTTIKTTQKVDVETIKTNAVVNGGTVTFPTNATLASTTNITGASGITLAGVTHTNAVIPTVTTVNGLANNSVTAAALATDAVGEIADGVWDEALSGHLSGGTAGKALKKAEDIIAREGTAQAGGNNTITLDAGASAVNDFYVPGLVALTGGTGAGQFRRMTAYNGGTKVATVANDWATNPDGTTTFSILPWATVRVTTIENDVITAAALAADAVGEIADQVWDEARADHVGAGSFGQGVASVQGNVTGSVGSLGTTAKSDVNAEVVDALNVDTYAEIGQETPAATQTVRKMLAFLYKAWRNKSDQTATLYQLYNDDAATVDQKATVSDDGTTFTRGEVGTGP